MKSIARVLRTPLNASSPVFAVHVGPSLSHLELAYKETDRYAVQRRQAKIRLLILAPPVMSFHHRAFTLKISSPMAGGGGSRQTRVLLLWLTWYSTTENPQCIVGARSPVSNGPIYSSRQKTTNRERIRSRENISLVQHCSFTLRYDATPQM
jgi:hypothetical protein